MFSKTFTFVNCVNISNIHDNTVLLCKPTQPSKTTSNRFQLQSILHSEQSVINDQINNSVIRQDFLIILILHSEHGFRTSNILSI